MTRRPYVEHCPECEQTIVCLPLSVVPTSPDGISAQYRCPSCLYSWRTGWLREPTNQEH